MEPHASASEASLALALNEGRCEDPFAVLGLQAGASSDALRLRVFRPDADAVWVHAPGPAGWRVQMDRIGHSGLFAADVPTRARDEGYLLDISSGAHAWRAEDPYRFGPWLGDLDAWLLAEGRHLRPWTKLGAHPGQFEGTQGTAFAVWAPNARRVSVVGTFNQWDGRIHPMRRRPECGVWEIFLPAVAVGDLYKFELLDIHGALRLKADPYARESEGPPGNASRVASPLPGERASTMPDDAGEPATHPRRQGATPARECGTPLAIYEVHAASWRRLQGQVADWDELAATLVPYVASLGFTHVELLPVTEHPFQGSWGYQPTGMYAPVAQHGSPQAFARFVHAAHDAGLGVILDWVPAHFPSDEHALVRFDGTPLYEHADPREGFHRDWNTLIYNFGRNEVRNFLTGSALFWIETYGVDGLRVDAVASMLYRDYSRPEGEWVPNRYGGRENLEAIDFLQHTNDVLHGEAPHAAMIAEESTAFRGVTSDTASGGLGFDFKWNMGWMHDTLRYFGRDPSHRRWHHDDISFAMVYAWSERYVLPLSHDEVVHGKGSLLSKMWGDGWQKRANLRALYGLMYAFPGAKLLFMGAELATPDEWNHDAELDWNLLAIPEHAGVQRLVGDLNRGYRNHAALHARDTEAGGFQWVVVDDRDNSVFAFLRWGHQADEVVLAVCNFTPVPRQGYRVGAPLGGHWQEILNTDSDHYGGSNIGNGGRVEAHGEPLHGQPCSLELVLPPLGVVWLTPLKATAR